MATGEQIADKIMTRALERSRKGKLYTAFGSRIDDHSTHNSLREAIKAAKKQTKENSNGIV